MNAHFLRLLILACVGCGATGCSRAIAKNPPSRQREAATAPVASDTQSDAKSSTSPGGSFTYAPAAIAVSWPAGWAQKKDDEYEWEIVPSESNDRDWWISLDVPKLPWHPPGMIPVGRVESGYVDDLKGKYGDVSVKELTPPKLPDAKVRSCRCSWTKDGKQMQQTGLLIVHNDRVYILRARSDAAHEQQTCDVFNQVVSSIQWVKK